MIHELIVALICFSLGVISRLIYVGVSALESKIKLTFITVLFDIIMILMAVSLFALYVFVYRDGIFLPYMVLSYLIGFILLSVFI